MEIPTIKAIERKIKIPFKQWARQCHAISLAIVKSGLLGDRVRVARGTCPRVGGQHSWVVMGWDCYDPEVEILDPVLWSYDLSVTGLWHGRADELPHIPHGNGSIWNYGRPNDPTGPIIELNGLSKEAMHFLEMAAPEGLDMRGWGVLARAPIRGWPSKEIISAMYKNEQLKFLIPIDIAGMLTDFNPSGLYLPK